MGKRVSPSNVPLKAVMDTMMFANLCGENCLFPSHVFRIVFPVFEKAREAFFREALVVGIALNLKSAVVRGPQW
jgi:hypothetical protein